MITFVFLLDLRRAEEDQVVPEMGTPEVSGILAEAEPQGQVVPTVGHRMFLHYYLHNEEECEEDENVPIPESRIDPQGDDDDSIFIMPPEHHEYNTVTVINVTSW